MEIPLRGISRVQLNTFIFTLKHWKDTFLTWEKVSLLGIAVLLVLTSATWAWAAAQSKTVAPREGGVFVEGIVTNNIDSVDLGRLTKSGLTKINEKGEVSPDLANSWTISQDKLSYNFSLVDKVTAYELAEIIKNSPTYLPGASFAPADIKTLTITLKQPDSSLLVQASQPIFPYGPFSVDKKTNNEIRLKRSASYHLQKSYLDKFIIRIYQDKSALQKAADRGKVNGAIGLDKAPDKWQAKDISLGKKHFLFINSSKTYLKKTKTRETLLKGEKPDSLTSIDVLEVNGEQEDSEFTAWKSKLKSAGVEVKSRKVSLKDALKEDLPKRNYDVLYILIAEGQTQDPYLLWNSMERSSVGQNFAELANADIDELTEQYREESDAKKKNEISSKIKELVEKEKIAVEYKNLTAKYAVSAKIKGLAFSPMLSSEADRFTQAGSWYIYEKKVR